MHVSYLSRRLLKNKSSHIQRRTRKLRQLKKDENICLNHYRLKISLIDSEKRKPLPIHQKRLSFQSIIHSAHSTPSAFAALSRPPVETLPFNESSRSTEFNIRSRKFSTEIFGFEAIINAATPATSGVAIEVPEASRN